MKQFALANAPAYAHPRFVWFVDELPLASTNKLDRAALQKMADRARFPGATQHEVMRCRTGIVANSEFSTIPEQQCNTPRERRSVLHCIRETLLFLRGH